MSSKTQLKPGSALQGGKYRILSVLGQGGFGITYEAEQVALGRKVTVKEFFMEEYCNRDGDTSRVSVPSVGSRETVDRFRAKFVKEAKMIAGLDHQNIIRIHDVFEENGTAYYVMEYLSGGSLLDLQKSKGRLSESDALAYVRQAASALDYIHSLKINHLDIKPGNILLDGKGRAVLIDFGLSKRYDIEGQPDQHDTRRHQPRICPSGTVQDRRRGDIQPGDGHLFAWRHAVQAADGPDPAGCGRDQR